jgi:tripartite-type tricarboxylate transporter receptor subunit TctC
VPYRGAPPALNDLMGGHVPSMFGTVLAAVPHVRLGKIRALAVTGPRRSVALPDVPDFAEAVCPTMKRAPGTALPCLRERRVRSSIACRARSPRL